MIIQPMFSPALYGSATWGSGADFTWTFNINGTNPTMAFSDGQISLGANNLVTTGSLVTAGNTIHINPLSHMAIQAWSNIVETEYYLLMYDQDGNLGFGAKRLVLYDDGTTAGELVLDTDLVVTGDVSLTAGDIYLLNGGTIGVLGGLALTFNDTDGQFELTGGNLIIPDDGYVGSATAPTAIQIKGDGDVVLVKDLTTTGIVKASAGTAAAPSYTFIGDENTGFYRVSEGRLGFTCNSAPKFTVSKTVTLFQDSIFQNRVTSATLSPLFDFQRIKLPAPYVPINGDILGTLRFSGGRGAFFEAGAEIRVTAIETFVEDTAAGSKMELLTTPAGSITPVTRVLINADGSVDIGDGTNELQVSATGDLLFAGDATVFNDLQFQISDAKVTPASLLPSWETFTTNTSEYAFSVNDEVDTSANEMPHSWKEGTAGHAHIHITTKAVPAQEQKAQFTITFAYADTNEVWVEAPLTAELTIPIATTALTNFYLDLGDLTLTNYLVGAQIRCRVKRVAKSAGGTEYVGDIFITQVGIHFEEDTVGSRTELAK